ncbi:MAG: ribonuclease E/G [Proteobacteria bacterium]|nr:ribonuclease E/G [Pseudomonadota bacterium]
MIDELLVSATPFGVRTAAIADSKVVAFNVESAHAQSLLGNIYLAAEGRRGNAAHFVAIGKEQNAFLEKSGGANPGSNPLVQVTRAAWHGKAPRVSAAVALAGRYMVFFPQAPGASVARRICDTAERDRLLALARLIAGDGANGGVTIRSAAEAAPDDAILAEAARHRQHWSELCAKRATVAAPALLARGLGLAERQMRDILPPRARIITDDRATLVRLAAYAAEWTPEFNQRLELADAALFERHDAMGALAAALAPQVPLTGGGRLSIEPTQALTAIDVDTGVRPGPRDRVLRAACGDAVIAAAREIRRRNLAGLIVIDFPRLDAADAGQALMADMQAQMKDDPVPHKVAAISASGLMEITRRRGDTPILEALTEPVDGSYGGRRQRLDALAFDIAQAARLQVQAGARAVTLCVAPALGEFFSQAAGDGEVTGYAALGAWLRAGVTLREEPARRREDWAIETA